MATTTTNLGLTKPAYADTADIAVINGNMDKIDAAANGLEAGIAIVSNNNTHAAVSKGQYVYVRNHGSLSEGMYKANSNIAANGTLSNSNVTAVSGGLGADVASNADAIATLNSKSKVKTISLSFNSSGYCDKAYTDIGFSSGQFCFVPTQYISGATFFILARDIGNSTIRFYIFTDGSCTAYKTNQSDAISVKYILFDS